MSSFTRPAGPLPRRVYWVRRGVVLAVALVLVFGVVRALSLIGGGSGDEGPQAATVAAEQDPASDTTAGSDDPAEADPAADANPDDSEQPGKKPKNKKRALPKPDGPCDPADVVITPKVGTVFASEAIDLRLVARTEESPACTFDFGPDTVSLKIRAKKAEGWDQIWTSVHCPTQVPEEQLVLRNNRKAKVDFTWWGRRSAEDCVRTVKWALPGTYYLTAAALGGQPVEDRFLLDPPKPVYVTEEPKPKKGKQDKQRGAAADTEQATESDTAQDAKPEKDRKQKKKAQKKKQKQSAQAEETEANGG